MKKADFDVVVEQGAEFQRRFPGKQLVAVGGTAAALHCGHRFSLDVDCVTPFLKNEYDAFAEALEHWPGWRTNRKNPPDWNFVGHVAVRQKSLLPMKVVISRVVAPKQVLPARTWFCVLFLLVL